MTASSSPLDALQRRLDYTFRDAGLLREAVTHPSYLAEHPDAGPPNQRMEFLGDAVLLLLLTEKLFQLFPGEREGVLTKRRALLCKGSFLAQMSREIGLDACLLMSATEEATGGRAKEGALEDAFEALVAAVYVDSDLPTATRVVLGIYGDLAARLAPIEGGQNPKGQLQERFHQKLGTSALRYETMSTSGPDHARTFEVAVYLQDRLIGQGRGSTKKMAEEAAARAALDDPSCPNPSPSARG